MARFFPTALAYVVTFATHIVFLLDSPGMHYSFKKCHLKRKDSKEIVSRWKGKAKGKGFSTCLWPPEKEKVGGKMRKGLTNGRMFPKR